MVRASTIFAFLVGGAIVFVWRQIRYTNVQHIEAERKVERKVYTQKLKFSKAQNKTFSQSKVNLLNQTTKSPVARVVTKPQIIKPIVIRRPVTTKTFRTRQTTKSPVARIVTKPQIIKPITSNQTKLRRTTKSPVARVVTKPQIIKPIVIRRPVTKKLLFIIPFRDRHKHFDSFKQHVKGLSSKFAIDVYVVEQANEDYFNRGWLLNVGLKEAQSRNVAYDCVITSDVDIFGDVDYSWCDRPTHICSEMSCHGNSVPYHTNAGGVLTAKLSDWEKINGYTNKGIGWGGEDDDLFHRFRQANLLTGKTLRRPAKGKGKCDCLHDKDHTKRVRHEGSYSKILRQIRRMSGSSKEWKTDGLNNVKYSVDSVEQINNENFSITWFKIRLKSLFSIGIKTLNKYKKVIDQINSIRKFYSSATIYVVDDGHNNEIHHYKNLQNVFYKKVAFDTGLSECRNILVKWADTKYIVIMDDDMYWTKSFDINLGISRLQKTNKYILSGALRGSDPYFGLLLEENKKTHLCRKKVLNAVVSTCYDSDIGLNILIAERNFLLQNPWDKTFKIGEHEHYFLKLKQKRPNSVLVCTDMLVEHNTDGGGWVTVQKTEYDKLRFRAFAEQKRAMGSFQYHTTFDKECARLMKATEKKQRKFLLSTPNPNPKRTHSSKNLRLKYLENKIHTQQKWHFLIDQNVGNIEWNKMTPKEILFSMDSKEVGANNYFNILQHDNKTYIYYRCDNEIPNHTSEVGNRACVRTSDDFNKEIVIDVADLCLAFWVFIDTNPKSIHKFKAVYGVRERRGSGDWWAAYSDDGINFTNIKIIWNRKKFISKRGLYAFDALNTVYFDNKMNKYVAHARYVDDWEHRTVMTSTSDDFLHWKINDWKILKFHPSLNSEYGTSLYLMNAHKCPVDDCDYMIGFNTRLNAYGIPGCKQTSLGKKARSNCENGHIDIGFSISKDNLNFKHSLYNHALEKDYGDDFPRNLWSIGGYTKTDTHIYYYVLHDAVFPKPYIRKYSIKYNRYASLTCKECEIVMSGNANVKDIKLNAKTNNMYGNIKYQLVFYKNNKALDIKCTFADSAKFFGDEIDYSIRFGYQKWQRLLEKKALTHGGKKLEIWNWYLKNTKDKYPIKMPKKGMTYRDCFNLYDNADRVDIQIKLKHSSLYAVYL